MQQALRQHGLPLIARMLTSGSPLIDAGFVQPDGLAAVHARLAGGGDFRERETELYGLIVMDLALRAFACAAGAQAAATATRTGRPGWASARRASPVNRNPLCSFSRITSQPWTSR